MGTLLITGGAGFIGSNLVHYALEHASDRLVILDKLTYAGSLHNLEGALEDRRGGFLQRGIAGAAAGGGRLSPPPPAPGRELPPPAHPPTPHPTPPPLLRPHP